MQPQEDSGRRYASNLYISLFYRTSAAPSIRRSRKSEGVSWDGGPLIAYEEGQITEDEEIAFLNTGGNGGVLATGGTTSVWVRLSSRLG